MNRKDRRKTRDNAKVLLKQKRIMERFKKNEEFFDKLSLKDLVQILKTNVVDVCLEGKEIKFKCSSTDLAALHQSLRKKYDKITKKEVGDEEK